MVSGPRSDSLAFLLLRLLPFPLADGRLLFAYHYYPQLAPSEVAEAFWCPVSVLCGPRSRIECLRLPMASLTVPPSAVVRLAHLLGVRSLFFPCIHLRGRDPRWALWGLSFGIVSDLLRVAGLPSFAERRPAELRAAHPAGLSRQATLPFLTDSRLVNALLPAYVQRRRLWVVVVVGGAVGAVVVSMGALAAQRRHGYE